MTDLVSSRLAGRGDRAVLEALKTCRHEKPFGQRREVCLEPWSHEVQSYIRTDSLGTFLGRRDTDDHRLLLLFDGPRLVGAACHERVPDAPEPARYVGALAVDVAVRGLRLSNDRSAASCLMDTLLNDIRTTPDRPAVALADVHGDNEAALRLLRHRQFNVGSTAANGYRPAALRL